MTVGLPATAAPPRRVGRPAVVGALALAVVAVAAASLLVGAQAVPIRTVVDALAGTAPGDPAQLVVTQLRLPRTLVGLLAGAALGLAGALGQGLTRNPLADPGILGVNAGAALAIVVGIAAFGLSTLTGYVWFGLGGAALAAAAVYAVGAAGGRSTPLTLALSGAAFTAGIGSVTRAVLLTDTTTYDEFRFWQVGSLAARDLGVAAQATPFVAVGAVVALLSAPALDALALGDDVARGWGRHVGRDRAVGAAALVVLAGTATAMVGPIAFLGLTVPHLARALVGPGHRWLLPVSMLLGPVVLLGADVVGRVLASPGEVAVGIVVAVIGAPFFIAVVRRRRWARL